MGNAVEYKPPHGAFARAARNMGKTRQEVERGYKNKVTRFMVAVAQAGIEINQEELAEHVKYRDLVRRSNQLAKEVNEMAALVSEIKQKDSFHDR